MMIADHADKIVAQAEKSGATQTEVYAIRVKTASTYIDDNIPKIGGSMTEFGIGLKFVIGKRIGFTSSTLAQETTEAVVERAKSLARVTNMDDKFVSLPAPKKASGSPNRFHDSDTAAADSTVLMEKAMDVVKAASAKNVAVPNGSLRTSSVEYHISNSLGIDAGSKGTIAFGFFTAKSQNKDGVGEGVQHCWSREIGSIDFYAVGEQMKSQALSVLKARPFREKWENATAVLAPSEVAGMVCTLLGFAASGENVNKKSSPWADKIGERVASRNLSIVDNGFSKRGLLSGIVDEEGVPTQKTTILEKGILKSYLFDSYNAYQLEMTSTGNGTRRTGITGRRTARELAGRFSVPAECDATTIEVKPSTKSVEDIIGEVKRGVYIEHFAYPLVDEFSGTFSNEIRNGRLIENGELGRPIKYALWVGNLYESIKGNLLVADNPEVHDIGVMPTLAFPNTEIVGQ